MKPAAPELKFPVQWEFRVAVEAARSDEVRNLLPGVLSSAGLEPGEIADGLRSGTGRYVTLKTRVMLPSHEAMDKAASLIAALPGVRFVL
ncbi:MAG: DUF493 family protein [Victivallaceae bacterium]|nr:DUF493 family protein [Victivallaceae bacterium]